MSILKSLGIEEYTSKFKGWIDNKLLDYVKKEELSIIPVEKITYAELVKRRNEKLLVADNRYRIVDYVTTTTQWDTRSTGHPFDIIVTADSVDSLNENARAILHDGDNYFAGSNLAAWELKYCLDNDTKRFAWADAETHVEIRLEVDDFLKNQISAFTIDSQIPDVLKFSWWDSPRNGTEDYGDVYSCDNLQSPAESFLCLVYPHGTDVLANPELCIPNICLNGQPTDVTLEYDNDGDGIIDKKYIPTSSEFSNGKGVIYYMKDEFNNECPYDFKNIQFKRYKIKITRDVPEDGENLNYKQQVESYYSGFCVNSSIDGFPEGRSLPGIEVLLNGDFQWYHTFQGHYNSTYFDASLNVASEMLCRRNKIEQCVRKQIQYLNNIVIKGSKQTANESMCDNVFNSNCFYITLGCEHEKCQVWGNSFGRFSRSVIIVANMVPTASNTGIWQNSFGDNFAHDFSAASMTQNNFAGYLQNCFFWKVVDRNTTGMQIRGNVFLDTFVLNEICDFFYSNVVSGKFHYNIVREHAKNNTITSPDIIFNHIYPYFRNNQIESDIFGYNIIREYAQNNIMKCNKFGKNNIDDAFKNNTFEGDFLFNKLGSQFTDNSAKNFNGNTIGANCRNNHFNADTKQCFIGHEFKYNTIENNIEQSSFGGNLQYNRFVSDSDVKNIFVQSEISGSAGNIQEITLPSNSVSEIKVAKNSQGEIKVYCEADLIA